MRGLQFTEEGGGDSLTCNCGATHVNSTPITLCVPFCKCPWALARHVGARGGWALTRVLRPGKTMSILCDTIVFITDDIISFKNGDRACLSWHNRASHILCRHEVSVLNVN